MIWKAGRAEPAYNFNQETQLRATKRKINKLYINPALLMLATNTGKSCISYMENCPHRSSSTCSTIMFVWLIKSQVPFKCQTTQGMWGLVFIYQVHFMFFVCTPAIESVKGAELLHEILSFQFITMALLCILYIILQWQLCA